MCKGVEAGWVDTMLTPWKYNKGKVMVMRDAAERRALLGSRRHPAAQRGASTTTGRSWRAGRRRKAATLDFDMVVHDLQFASILPKKSGGAA